VSPDLRRSGQLRFQIGFSCGAIVTLKILARSVANIQQLERGGFFLWRYRLLSRKLVIGRDLRDALTRDDIACLR
jgi:hypothetical protein